MLNAQLTTTRPHVKGARLSGSGLTSHPADAVALRRPKRRLRFPSLPARGVRELSDEDIDAIARRMADILHETRQSAPALIDAGEVARRYGVSREWVYDHAGLLGALTLGDGARPRLRFDPDRVAAVLGRSSSSAPTETTRAPKKRATDSSSAPQAGSRLPIRGRGLFRAARMTPLHRVR